MLAMFNFAVLDPKGLIALQERDLMITAVLLMLIVVIPAYVLLAVFSWKYRAGNRKATYAPDTHNVKYEILWWAIPSLVILVLAVITWQKTHDLDPYKPLESENPPITIQVVALQWKWLFIYPEQNIATVNFIQVPVNTPIHFKLTADEAPMNSMWIPELGGQMYAMAGMSTNLHLIANEEGDFAGSAAEINGEGFSGMRFTTRATSREEFDQWVNLVQQSRNTLDMNGYERLVKPSMNNPVNYYSLVESDLYNRIIMKYMPPGAPMDENAHHMMSH